MERHHLESNFRVEEIVPEQRDIWLEDLSASRSGLLISVNISDNYEDNMMNKIDNLNEGDIINAEICSSKDSPTIWEFSSIEVVDKAANKASTVPA